MQQIYSRYKLLYVHEPHHVYQMQCNKLLSKTLKDRKRRCMDFLGERTYIANSKASLGPTKI